MRKLTIAILFSVVSAMSLTCFAQDSTSVPTVAVEQSQVAVATTAEAVQPIPTDWLMDLTTTFAAKYPVILTVLMILGLILVVVQVVVVITPTKKDDKFINEKIKGNSIFLGLWNFILSFAPIQKTSDGLKLSKQ